MANWRNKIKIKEFMSEDTSNEAVLKVCEILIPQLEKLLEEEKKRNIDEYFTDTLEEIFDNFKFVKHGIENEEDSNEYKFESWCEAFNEYLDELYDLGDTIVTKRNFYNDENFLWID